jgi:hypothetical protein
VVLESWSGSRTPSKAAMGFRFSPLVQAILRGVLGVISQDESSSGASESAVRLQGRMQGYYVWQDRGTASSCGTALAAQLEYLARINPGCDVRAINENGLVDFRLSQNGSP